MSTSSDLLAEIKRDLQSVLRKIDSLPGEMVFDGASPRTRNPDYFLKSGHLSEAGIGAAEAMFEKSCSIQEVANELLISMRGAANRKKIWLEKKEGKEAIS